jgi:hypothetical protein
MQTLRHAHLLARFVLVWFVCALGVAVASPMVHPQAMELVCSSGGAVKLLVKTDNGVQEMGAHSLDCPLCLVGGAPPPQATPTAAAPVQPLAYVLRSIPAARLAARTAAPLPARGPPTLFAI